MTPVKSFKEHKDTHIILSSKLPILKSSAIYGSNGGGKSNFILAMGFMKGLIHNSFADSLKNDEDRTFTEYHYRLSQGASDQASSFEVSFIHQDIIYRYGFKVKRFEIISEWLYKKAETETPLFTRELSKFNINKNSFSEGAKYVKEVNSNVLFVSHLAQFNSPVSKIVFNWFRGLNVVSGLNEDRYKSATSVLLKSIPGFKAWLSLAVRFLEISNIEADQDGQIITYHNKYDDNNTIIDSVPFALEKEESLGTRKLIYLLGAIYDTLKFQKILFIDELDSKLHPNLTKRLMVFFHKLNQDKAQFVFTAHDAILLDKDLLRRDQIWFVDRNRFGESELYGMSEFDSSVIRNTSDFRKKYLDSVFGAAETINITDELIALMDN